MRMELPTIDTLIVDVNPIVTHGHVPPSWAALQRSLVVHSTDEVCALLQQRHDGLVQDLITALASLLRDGLERVAGVGVSSPQDALAACALIATMAARSTQTVLPLVLHAIGFTAASAHVPDVGGGESNMTSGSGSSGSCNFASAAQAAATDVVASLWSQTQFFARVALATGHQLGGSSLGSSSAVQNIACVRRQSAAAAAHLLLLCSDDPWPHLLSLQEPAADGNNGAEVAACTLELLCVFLEAVNDRGFAMPPMKRSLLRLDLQRNAHHVLAAMDTAVHAAAGSAFGTRATVAAFQALMGFATHSVTAAPQEICPQLWRSLPNSSMLAVTMSAAAGVAPSSSVAWNAADEAVAVSAVLALCTCFEAIVEVDDDAGGESGGGAGALIALALQFVLNTAPRECAMRVLSSLCDGCVPSLLASGCAAQDTFVKTLGLLVGAIEQADEAAWRSMLVVITLLARALREASIPPCEEDDDEGDYEEFCASINEENARIRCAASAIAPLVADALPAVVRRVLHMGDAGSQSGENSLDDELLEFACRVRATRWRWHWQPVTTFPPIHDPFEVEGENDLVASHCALAEMTALLAAVNLDACSNLLHEILANEVLPFLDAVQGNANGCGAAAIERTAALCWIVLDAIVAASPHIAVALGSLREVRVIRLFASSAAFALDNAVRLGAGQQLSPLSCALAVYSLHHWPLRGDEADSSSGGRCKSTGFLESAPAESSTENFNDLILELLQSTSKGANGAVVAQLLDSIVLVAVGAACRCGRGFLAPAASFAAACHGLGGAVAANAAAFGTGSALALLHSLGFLLTHCSTSTREDSTLIDAVASWHHEWSSALAEFDSPSATSSAMAVVAAWAWLRLACSVVVGDCARSISSCHVSNLLDDLAVLDKQERSGCGSQQQLCMPPSATGRSCTSARDFLFAEASALLQRCISVHHPPGVEVVNLLNERMDRPVNAAANSIEPATIAAALLVSACRSCADPGDREAYAVVRFLFATCGGTGVQLPADAWRRVVDTLYFFVPDGSGAVGELEMHGGEKCLLAALLSQVAPGPEVVDTIAGAAAAVCTGAAFADEPDSDRMHLLASALRLWTALADSGLVTTMSLSQSVAGVMSWCLEHPALVATMEKSVEMGDGGEGGHNLLRTLATLVCHAKAHGVGEDADVALAGAVCGPVTALLLAMPHTAQMRHHEEHKVAALQHRLVVGRDVADVAEGIAQLLKLAAASSGSPFM